jgi:hypothetical protein
VSSSLVKCRINLFGTKGAEDVGLNLRRANVDGLAGVDGRIAPVDAKGLALDAGDVVVEEDVRDAEVGVDCVQDAVHGDVLVLDGVGSTLPLDAGLQAIAALHGGRGQSGAGEKGGGGESEEAHVEGRFKYICVDIYVGVVRKRVGLSP